MKRAIITSFFLIIAGIAPAGNLPSDLTGLWRFQNATDKLKATIGADLVSSHPDNSGFFLGPWTVIDPGLSDGGVVQERSWDYLTVNPGFSANGGGTYVNEYTILIDYVQTSALDQSNSLFQTSLNGHDNDGDLWTDGAGRIGSGEAGFSALTYSASTWHRIVWSVKNGSFFRVYVDGTNYLDGIPQTVDGRMSLYTDRFHLFADDSWQDGWGLVGTVATWNRALTAVEISGMGGWLEGSAVPTPLTIEQPPTLSYSLVGNHSTSIGPGTLRDIPSNRRLTHRLDPGAR